MEYAQSVSTKCACFSDAASMTAVRPCASLSPASAPAASIFATRATSGSLFAHSSLKWRPAWARANAAPVVIAASTSPTPIFLTALIADAVAAFEHPCCDYYSSQCFRYVRIAAR